MATAKKVALKASTTPELIVKAPVLTDAQLADEIGDLDAKVKKLKKQLEFKKELAKKTGKRVLLGKKWCLMVKTESQQRVDTDKVKELLGSKTPMMDVEMVKVHVSKA